MTQKEQPALEDAADMKKRVRDSFDRQGLMRHLGATLIAIEPGEVHIKLPFRDELTQQHGYFHAGGTSAIADTAGGFAGLTLFPAGSSVLTVEFKVNLIAPARGDHLEAVGKVVRSGRTLTICHLEVFAVHSGERVLVAVGQQTLMCVRDRPADRA
ncbi:DUF4442 domain-containing protein [Pollutimonas subterranea]|uniref:DUF4442 domain-containing protein n=1 Tax=Pollutimonas subterranea TaxID=2045210 RepID=A0A2N4TZH8_9BURK|nr:PaaI family thioesterase [Pollutimonas subterranea]PLC48169.1 DUF4442 domain-containing protein [Pollutimonas subterranea]